MALFSLMVNYHAVNLLAEFLNGFGICSTQRQSLLKIALIAMPNYQERSYPRTRCSFNQVLDPFAPHDFFTVQTNTKEDASEITLEHAYSLLRMSRYDPDIFYKLRDSFYVHGPTSPEALRADILEAIPLIWKNFYYIEDRDIAFDLARLYYGLEEYVPALEYYQISQRLFGHHYVTYHNVGLTLYHLGKKPESLECFKASVKENGEYAPAQSWLEKLNNELANLASSSVGAVATIATTATVSAPSSGTTPAAGAGTVTAPPVPAPAAAASAPATGGTRRN